MVYSTACDVLIVGSGAAGLRAAIEAVKRKVDVILVSKDDIGSNNCTAVSAAVISSSIVHLEPKDSPEIHYEDIVRKGRFLCEHNLARILAYEIPCEILMLKELGIRFSMVRDKISSGWAPGHTYPRGCFCVSRSGLEITKPLKNEALKLGVKFLPNVMVTQLITDLIDEGVNGVIGINRETGEPILITSKSIVLATGGAGGIYKYTDNPSSMTGDGYVLAYEAGAELIDMEFVQFHPAIEHPQLPKHNVPYHSLIARGAVFRNALGEDIFRKYNLVDTKEMTRDIVSRIMMTEILEGRSINGKIMLEISDETQLYSFDKVFQKIIQLQDIKVKEKLLL
ncbi:MAG: FAD-dependent oxidoreductase, partial [Nitrososphaeria archaeon]|nr:FAD-dependent oxidoreductase [Nitrososphaeria archaeon]